MSTEEEALNSLAAAVSHKLNNDISNTMETHLKTFTDSLKVMDNLLKKQEAAEMRAEQRMASFEKCLSEKQANSDRVNNDRFTVIEKRLSELETNLNKSRRASSGLSDDSSLNTSSQPIQSHNCSSTVLVAIKDIVSHASTIIGLGPITASYIDTFDGENATQKMCGAATFFTVN